MTTSLQTPVSETDWYQLARLRERNDFSYCSTVDYKDLPQPGGRVAHEALPDRVLVTATDIDVLGEWLHVMGGTVTTVDLPHGQTVWTLATSTWSDSPKFPVVPVFVSVVLATGASVMCEIRAAVKS
ncbi:hypothetical protein [Streptomyces longwoodensis]|uniref:hypothetical protein n=1 Tax=Streptomyces longwoodensis TaxID=68231 RepID=UPI0036EA3391